MKLIIGLGNPGSEYVHTRHNAGRRLVDYIAKQHKINFSKKRSLKASLAQFEWEGSPVILAYPEVFMNLSGESVHRLVRHFALNAQKNLLVVVDDSALPFGQLRLRSRGSDGGHNGLKSIHQELGHQDYARLRLGIGMPEADSLEKYVLSSFSAAEKKSLSPFLEKGYEACRLWIADTIEQAMNAVNARKTTS